MQVLFSAKIRKWMTRYCLVIHLLQEQRVMFSALLSEVRAELIFLLFGQVGLNDLELLTLDRLSNLVTAAPLSNKNKAEVPGVILARTWLMKSSSIP